MKDQIECFIVIRQEMTFDETLKRVFFDREQAEQEVNRLNQLNANKGCVYTLAYCRMAKEDFLRKAKDELHDKGIG